MFLGYGLAVSLSFISRLASASVFAAWTEESIRQLREQHDLPFVRADAEGMVVEINQRFREVYGWFDKQLIGQSLGLIFPTPPTVSATRTTQALLAFSSRRSQKFSTIR